jgi:hypothetical protein
VAATDQPRLLRDPQQIALRRTQLREPHIRRLSDFAQRLRDCGFGSVPDFDPWDGGVNAQALFLYEKPGPKAFASGFISRNNNDKTAENTFHFMEKAGIPRKATCLWNVVPGWNGTIRLTPHEESRGREALTQLLTILPALKVVVLVGKRAVHAWSRMERATGLPLIQSAHPSPKNYALARDIWNAIPDQWAQVLPYLDASLACMERSTPQGC